MRIFVLLVLAQIVTRKTLFSNWVFLLIELIINLLKKVHALTPIIYTFVKVLNHSLPHLPTVVLEQHALNKGIPD